MQKSTDQNTNNTVGEGALRPALDSTPAEAEGILPSIANKLGDTFENGFLIQTIEEAGYAHHSTFTANDIEHRIYYNQETESAYVFTDSLTVPGRPTSQGAIAVIPVDNMLVPAVMIPAPSATTFVNTLVSDEGAFNSDAWKYYMNYCSSSGQVDVYLHESVHLEQVLSGTPWGQAVASHATHSMLAEYQAAGFFPETSTALKEAMAEGKPDTDTLIAAELTQEILAHVANPDTSPERAQVATVTAARLHEQISDPFDRQTAEAPVRKVISDWCNYISQFSYPEPTETAIDIATAWILDVRHF